MCVDSLALVHKHNTWIQMNTLKMISIKLAGFAGMEVIIWGLGWLPLSRPGPYCFKKKDNL